MDINKQEIQDAVNKIEDEYFEGEFWSSSTPDDLEICLTELLEKGFKLYEATTIIDRVIIAMKCEYGE